MQLVYQQPALVWKFDLLINVFALQGVLGIKVKIMLDWDPKGKVGPITPLPDLVTIHSPKEEEEYNFTPALAASNIEIAAI